MSLEGKTWTPAEDVERLPAEHRAIRTAVALSSPTVEVVALRGDDARAAALHLLSSRLHLRDAQARLSLLCDTNGRPLADVCVAADDEDVLLFTRGLSRAALVEHVERSLPDGVKPTVEVLTESHDVVALDGPWAWELVAEVLGPDLVALPYLNFFRIDEGLCLRSGSTGEYGYELLVRKDTTDGVLAKIRDRGKAFDLVEVSAEALSVARFEGWFFDADHVPADATAIELGLDWRLAPDRSFQGSAAADARRAETTHRTCLLLSGPAAATDAVVLDGEVVGRITRALRSPVREAWVASAQLDARLRHSGIDRLVVRTAAGEIESLTVAPPLLDNRSLYVDPRRHAYATRGEVKFAPMVRAGSDRMTPR